LPFGHKRKIKSDREVTKFAEKERERKRREDLPWKDYGGAVN